MILLKARIEAYSFNSVLKEFETVFLQESLFQVKALYDNIRCMFQLCNSSSISPLKTKPS